jgi:hypothetical protein
MHSKKEIENEAYVREKDENRYPREGFYRVLTAHDHRSGSVNCQKQFHYVKNRREYLPTAGEHYPWKWYKGEPAVPCRPHINMLLNIIFCSTPEYNLL